MLIVAVQLQIESVERLKHEQAAKRAREEFKQVEDEVANIMETARFENERLERRLHLLEVGHCHADTASVGERSTYWYLLNSDTESHLANQSLGGEINVEGQLHTSGRTDP